MDDESKRRMEAIEMAALAKLREEIYCIVSEFKTIYDELQIEERTRLKSWLHDLRLVAERAPKSEVHVAVRVEFSSCTDDDSEHYAALSVQSACGAIECWDRGEQFTPKSDGGFF